MYKIVKITPLDNLTEATVNLKLIYHCKQENYPIGESRDGQLDDLAYFFAVRKIPIKTCVLGYVLRGEITAYDDNIASLSDYITYIAKEEVALIDAIMERLNEYSDRNDDIGIYNLFVGCDDFIKFFAQRNLPLRTCLKSWWPLPHYLGTRYNRKVLKNYREEIAKFL